MSGSVGNAIWDLAFECSPVVFTNGIAQNMPGGLLPVLLITEAINFPLGALSTGTLPTLDSAFAHWRPLAGTELVNWQFGEFPFANQAIAANAGISQPKVISMMMQCPAKGAFGYPAKLAVMVGLRVALEQHIALGGTFTVITPTGFYPNCLLLAVRDISGGESNQPQITWQWDFRQPLVTLEQAQQVQSSLMSKLSNGQQVDPSWSGLSPSVADPNSVAGPGVVPSAGTPAGLTAPLTPVQSTPLPPVPGVPTQGFNLVS